ncbi:antibiotic biosynthesis monooxygenase family protein [Ruegeria jejuensis]|uniref:antibiotic biosynthesis monooxygenase family protein n=1 Tax=Ruegeria jejuensis TaxID=3233338 RepID=UPI00355C8861
MAPRFEELDAITTLADQMQAEEGPIVLINLFTVDAKDEEALLAAWAHDADFMKTRPGYISTQLHKGIAGSSSFVNYAIWQDVQSFREAFNDPEFQSRLAEYPASAVARPHLFRKLAVENHCVA